MPSASELSTEVMCQVEGLRKQSTETRILYDKAKAALDALPAE